MAEDSNKPKNNLGKMLVSTSSNSELRKHFTSSAVTSSKSNTTEEKPKKLIQFFKRIGSSSKDSEFILTEHCYSKPWNWRPVSQFVKPTRLLFIPETIDDSRLRHPSVAIRAFKKSSCGSSDIDVERVTPPIAPVYVEKANAEGVSGWNAFGGGFTNRNDDDRSDWEDKVSKVNWNSQQHDLFSKMVRILDNDHLARLTYSGQPNEMFLCKNIIDKSVQRTRNLMAGIGWDCRLSHWLHVLLTDNLNNAYLKIYLDIVQSLRAKMPSLVDRMVYGPNNSNRSKTAAKRNFAIGALSRPSTNDPSNFIVYKPERLPNSPVLIVVPPNSHRSKRVRMWIHLLASLARVVDVYVKLDLDADDSNMEDVADQLLMLVVSKVQEVRESCPDAPIILVGFNASAAIVCQAAMLETVAALVCMGFPLLTTLGKRGEVDDVLFDIQCPVLFVIGQSSHRVSQEEIEDLRGRMQVTTGLIVVGSADDCLRADNRLKMTEGITQTVLDQCILDEISDFLKTILVAPALPNEVQDDPKDVSDADDLKDGLPSSMDGEPTKKSKRGRPKGSKNKPKPTTGNGIPGFDTTDDSDLLLTAYEIVDPVRPNITIKEGQIISLDDLDPPVTPCSISSANANQKPNPYIIYDDIPIIFDAGSEASRFYQIATDNDAPDAKTTTKNTDNDEVIVLDDDDDEDDGDYNNDYDNTRKDVVVNNNGDKSTENIVVDVDDDNNTHDEIHEDKKADDRNEKNDAKHADHDSKTIDDNDEVIIVDDDDDDEIIAKQSSSPMKILRNLLESPLEPKSGFPVRGNVYLKHQHYADANFHEDTIKKVFNPFPYFRTVKSNASHQQSSAAPNPVQIVRAAPCTLATPVNLTSEEILNLPIVFADDNNLAFNNTPDSSKRRLPQQQLSQPSKYSRVVYTHPKAMNEPNEKLKLETTPKISTDVKTINYTCTITGNNLKIMKIQPKNGDWPETDTNNNRES